MVAFRWLAVAAVALGAMALEARAGCGDHVRVNGQPAAVDGEAPPAPTPPCPGCQQSPARPLAPPSAPVTLTPIDIACLADRPGVDAGRHGPRPVEAEAALPPALSTPIFHPPRTRG